MMIEKKRIKCISCGVELPKDIVHIGEQYPSAIFLSDKNPAPPELKASSLNLTRCSNSKCTLVQLSNEYNLQYVFDHYPYESGSTATMRQILQDLVDDALSIVELTPKDVVLDIGGNDGTLLGLIKKPVSTLVNIDAAAGVKQLNDESNYVHLHAHFSYMEYQKLGLPPPKLITSVAMFYHLNDPLSFCRDIEKLMTNESVWVLQMTYFGTMLEDNILDNIVHEHVAYYSLYSVENLLSSIGLTIAEARIVKSYGGSLRLFIVKDPSAYPIDKWRKEYKLVQSYEEEHVTNSYEALYAFNSRVQLLRKSLKSLIDHINLEGLIWGFGASTKGNMILQFLGITTKDLPCILDNSHKKIGTKTTGSLIPIISEDKNLENIPGNLLVLPYYYTNAFINIIKKKLQPKKQVNLIIPLPYPHFITINGDDK